MGVALVLAYLASVAAPTVPPLGDVVALTALRRGDCIDVRVDGVAADRVGTDAQVIATVAAGKARRARCDAPHSHEVAGVTDFQFDGPYRGAQALITGASPACTADAADYLGRPLEGSGTALTVAIPDPTSWDSGDRRAACLVHRSDGVVASSPMVAH